MLAACLLTACGGGGVDAHPSTLPSSAQLPPSATGGSATGPLSANATTYTIPAVNGFSGTVTMPAATASVTGTMSIASKAGECSTVSPFGQTRTLQSQTITVFLCATFTPSADITYTTIPSIQLEIPASVSPVGKQFFYAVSVPPPANAVAQFRQEGPAAVVTTDSGCTVSFDAKFAVDKTPLTFKAGVPVFFAFYAVGATASPGPAPGSIVEYKSGFSAVATHLTLGPDGNIWFTSSVDKQIAGGDFNFVNRIGSITPSGSVKEYGNIFADKAAELTALTTGRDGNVWYGAGPPCYDCPTAAQAHLGRITTSGVPTDFSPVGSFPVSLTPGPDGNVWFTGGQSGSRGQVGHISPAGNVTSYTLPGFAGTTIVAGITAGPDGQLWFNATTSNAASTIQHITVGGTITELTAGSGTSIATGPDHNVWTTNNAGILRITPAGTQTAFGVANIFGSFQGLGNGDEVGSIAAGPDGNMWFSAASPARIGRITPQGVITFFTSGLSGQPAEIVAGSDGYMWFTEYSSGTPVNIAKIKT
ncbi:MAG: hypothetical protein NVSMB64_14110 [Candidatus Velthaea sp.]